MSSHLISVVAAVLGVLLSVGVNVAGIIQGGAVMEAKVDALSAIITPSALQEWAAQVAVRDYRLTLLEADLRAAETRLDAITKTCR